MLAIRNAREVLPPVMKADFTGSGSEELDRTLSAWGWSRLLDVCPIMRGHFVRNNAGEWTDFGLDDGMKDDIFGRYGLLNGALDGEPLFTWAYLSSIHPRVVIKGMRPLHPPDDPHFICIPSGWIKNAIDAAEQGIVRVASVRLSDCDPAPYVLIGHKAGGEKLQALSNGGIGFKYAPLSTWLASKLPR